MRRSCTRQGSAAVYKRDGEVRFAIPVNELSRCDIRVAAETSGEVVFGDPAAHRDSKPSPLGDQDEDLSARQVELLLERVAATGARHDRVGHRDLSGPGT